MSETAPVRYSNIDLHRIHRDIIHQTHNIFDWESAGQGRDSTLLRYTEWEDAKTGSHLRLNERTNKLAPFRLSVTPDSLHRSDPVVEYRYGSVDLYAAKLTRNERVSGGVAASEIYDHLQTFSTLPESERSMFDEFAAREVALDMKRTAFIARVLSATPRLRRRYIKSAVVTRAEREQVSPLLVQQYLLMETWQ